MLRTIPEKRCSHFHRGGSLQSRTVRNVTQTHTNPHLLQTVIVLLYRHTLMTGTQITFSFTSSLRATCFSFVLYLTLGCLRIDFAYLRPTTRTGCQELPLNNTHLEGACRGLIPNIWANDCETELKWKALLYVRVSKKSETSSTSDETNGFIRGYWKQRLQIVKFGVHLPIKSWNDVRMSEWPDCSREV